MNKDAATALTVLSTFTPPKIPRPGDYGKAFASPSTSTKKDRARKKLQRTNKTKARRRK